VTLGLWFASSALAAFPGADGLLAVQPASGGGILLVNAHGGVVRRICQVKVTCGTPRRPRWSPDGRAIAFSGPEVKIVYADGSCMNCMFGAAPNPAFEPGGTVISFIKRQHVSVDKIDGVPEGRVRVGTATDAVWSAGGKLAIVRDGALWAGRVYRLRPIGAGSEPSWSPGGDRIAAAQGGWVVIIVLRDHHVQRLARGTAPAFSPDGRWVAFVAPDHRLMIVAATGSHPRPRPVGRIKALSVDWQPVLRTPTPGCVAPRGSTVMASTPDAIVTQDGTMDGEFGFEFAPPIAYMGCLRADGRERLLERFADNSVDGATWASSAVLAAPYAALIDHSVDEHYGGSGDAIHVFDLRTGELRKDLGGESAECDGPICEALGQVLLGNDGVSAVHVRSEFASPPDVNLPLGDVACAPASTLCVSVAPLFDDLLTSTDPSGGHPSWTSSKLFAAYVPSTVACPSQSLCVGASGDNIYASSDPAGGASSWTATPVHGQPGGDYGVSCPNVSLCLVERRNGSIATSTAPASGAQAWTTTQIAPGDVLGALVCSAAPVCFVTHLFGHTSVFSSSDPTGGPGAWAASRTTPTFESGACPTASLCVTVDGKEIATSTHPNRAEWTKKAVPDSLDGVSCPSASLCVAVGDQGALDVSTDPASGSWTRATIDGRASLISVSCASTSLCVATDDNGSVVVSTNPTNASSWVPTRLETGPCAGAVPCSTEHIEASDKLGVHFLDDSEFTGAGPFLTGLTLSGDTLSWSHDGSPRTVELTPPPP
jgi:hypothetical protein